ncbi:MAG: acyl-CoA dehydratase activase [Pleomorphochaeta sp.]
MYSIGIDIGYSAIKIILINEENSIIFSKYKMHKGKIKETLLNLITETTTLYNIKDIGWGAVTGSGSKYLGKENLIEYINDVTAIVEGASLQKQKIGSIIDIGGESAKFISGINFEGKSNIEISMNSNCSSGTGSFLEEQMSRLNLNISDYSKLIKKAKTIPRIAGRCSVFAKTDITHHQQEGVAVEDILLGLAYSLIRNFKGTVIKKNPVTKPVLFTGGVAFNQGIINAINDILNLKEGELILPANLGCSGALGTALIANKKKIPIDINQIINLTKTATPPILESTLPQLKPFGKGDSLNKHICEEIDKTKITDCYLGIDIGSTSTNLVLINKNEEIINYQYLRTLGKPLNAVIEGLKVIKEKYGNTINIIGVGTTGSGRYMIGEEIGADVIKDEITSQARAAVKIDKNVDTIFEIGGQDSKFISINNGSVVDFQMNKICAAGTGSFIEEQAKKFNIPINDFGEIALNSTNPINLGERCTVFIESSIAACLSSGAHLNNIVSGLCYSIVKNYIDRVVGQKKIGNKIFFQGGVAYNQGVINAFREITKKEIIVPKFFSVTGAYGVAILTKEEVNTNNKSKFKGLEIDKKLIEINYLKNKKEKKQSHFDQDVKTLIFSDYNPKNNDPSKKTVGIPRALFTYGMFSMFNTFFKELDLNVILSDSTNEKTIALGQQYAMEETCYPIKLITGHVAELMQKKVDFIFFPDLVTIDHPGSKTRKNYGCAFMQLAFKVMNRAMDLDKKGIELLSPTMAVHLGPNEMMESFFKIGLQINKSKKEIQQALQKGMKAAENFEKLIENHSKKLMKNLKPNEKAFVIISKIYGVADPMLNMNIPDKLMNMGYKVFPFYDLPEGDISKEHPNMYWPFGQHILEPSLLVEKHPNLYPILLTHHGCGPDSVLSHFFKEGMKNKPYLHIEIDEHSSDVGIITRVEAFINSIKNIKVKNAENMNFYLNKIEHKATFINNNINEIDNTKKIFIPNIYPYSKLIEPILLKMGYNIKIMDSTSNESIEIGRKYTITEEYFSLTALLGNVFNSFNKLKKNDYRKTSLLVLQNEGAETNGQYSRLLRTKLDEEGFKDIEIISPYLEDVLFSNSYSFNKLYLSILAGDLILCAPQESRSSYLNIILKFLHNDLLTIKHLKTIAESIKKELDQKTYKKNILVVGEVNILFDDVLNNKTFKTLEEKNYKIVFSPLSETLLMFWKDYITQNINKNNSKTTQTLQEFESYINIISSNLNLWSPFEKNINTLIKRADNTIGYFSGSNGRYRQAKQLTDSKMIDGIITATSIYENTAIVLTMLQKSFKVKASKPILNLTFDGNKNENDQMKVDAFIYYL